MNVILIGFMATGKSTVGRALGRRLDAPYIDTDRELRRIFHGRSVAEVFAELGEEAFRSEETRLLQDLNAERNMTPGRYRQFPPRYILSTGGGTPLRAENAELLANLGHIVWLKAKTETIANRCRPHIAKRPLLHGHEHDLHDHIDQLLEHRAALYESVAHTSVWTDDELSPDQIALKIKEAIGGYRQ